MDFGSDDDELVPLRFLRTARRLEATFLFRVRSDSVGIRSLLRIGRGDAGSLALSLELK